MLVAFFESVKYVGHMYPVALMRIYLGYYFFNSALDRIRSEFLVYPRLADAVMDNLPQSDLPVWYARFLQYVIVPHWQFVAYFIVYCEIIIGIAFLLGLLVRPTAILGAFLMINFLLAGGSALAPLQQTFLAAFVVMFWVGAGRCLGFDYFFYKRQRGLWW